MPVTRPASPQTVAADLARDEALRAFERGEQQVGEDRMTDAVERKPQRGIEFGDLCMARNAPTAAMVCYARTPLEPPRVTARLRFEKQGDAFSRMAVVDEGIRIPCAVYAVQCYSSAYHEEPGAYAPHLKRFEMLSDAFCAERFGADWFDLRRYWEKHPDSDPSAAEGGERCFSLDLFVALVQELADTTRLLPFPQQLHDASFVWPWALEDNDTCMAALREHTVPLLEDLLLHRLPDTVRHTPALDAAAITAAGNLGRLPEFTRVVYDLLMAHQREFPLTARTLDPFVDACRSLASSVIPVELISQDVQGLGERLPEPLRERLRGLANGSTPVKHKFACITANPAAVELAHADRWYDAAPGLHNAMSPDHMLNLDALGPSFTPMALPFATRREFMEDLHNAPRTRLRLDLRSRPGTPDVSDGE